MEQLILGGDAGSVKPTCLRFATVYGVGRRMRFDLTVNEFTRELWADRELEVFGEQFWRPYIHVRDAGRAVRTVLEAPAEKVAEQCLQRGRSGENYRKLDLVEEIGKQIDRGKVSYVKRDEDPRDYKVSFDKIRAELAFETLMTVPTGSPRSSPRSTRGRSAIRSTAATEHPLSGRTGVRSTDGPTETFPELPLFDLRAAAAGPAGRRRDCLRSGWLTLGPRTPDFEEAFARQSARDTRSRSRAARRATSRLPRGRRDRAMR